MVGDLVFSDYNFISTIKRRQVRCNLPEESFFCFQARFFFWSCGGVESNDQLPAPDFYLIGNQSKIAETAHDISKSFLANPHRRYRVGISENENLVFELVNSRGLANYPYLRVSHERLENGKLHIEPINFLWGLDSTEGLSIVMKDDSGKEIKREKIQSSTRSVEDWIKLGAKAVALGFIFLAWRWDSEVFSSGNRLYSL